MLVLSAVSSRKDKAGRIKQPLLAYPAPAGARDVRPLLFASVQDFF